MPRIITTETSAETLVPSGTKTSKTPVVTKTQDPALKQLSEPQWKVLEAILPDPQVKKEGRGRKSVSLRRRSEGIYYVIANKLSWLVLNQTGPCSSTSAYYEFKRWLKRGTIASLKSESVFADIDWTRTTRKGSGRKVSK